MKWRGPKRTTGKLSTRGYIYLVARVIYSRLLCVILLTVQRLSCIFHFFFSRLTSDQRWMDERETCYWSLNATIEIPPAYMFNHRFRVLKNIIYEIRMKRSIFRSILSIASFSIIFLFGKENEKRLFYFVHYLLVPERISISSQNEILFQ